MNGARELNELISFVGRIKDNPCELSKLKNTGGYAQEYYKHKNILFLIGEHARGKTFHIWLYFTESITDYLKDEHIEVYGIQSGDPGWSEIYGWTAIGNWVDYIETYFDSLRQYRTEIKSQSISKNAEIANQNFIKLQENIELMNELFAKNTTTNTSK